LEEGPAVMVNPTPWIHFCEMMRKGVWTLSLSPTWSCCLRLLDWRSVGRERREMEREGEGKWKEGGRVCGRVVVKGGMERWDLYLHFLKDFVFYIPAGIIIHGKICVQILK
jgi:hypothetical protein